MAAWRGRAAAAPRALPGNRGNRGWANRNRGRAGSLPRCPSTARCRLGEGRAGGGSKALRPLRGRRLRELRGHVERGSAGFIPFPAGTRVPSAASRGAGPGWSRHRPAKPSRGFSKRIPSATTVPCGVPKGCSPRGRPAVCVGCGAII